MTIRTLTYNDRTYTYTTLGQDRQAYRYRLHDVTDPAAPINLGTCYGARYADGQGGTEWRWGRHYADRGYARLEELIAALIALPNASAA